MDSTEKNGENRDVDDFFAIVDTFRFFEISSRCRFLFSQTSRFWCRFRSIDLSLFERVDEEEHTQWCHLAYHINSIERVSFLATSQVKNRLKPGGLKIVHALFTVLVAHKIVNNLRAFNVSTKASD